MSFTSGPSVYYDTFTSFSDLRITQESPAIANDGGHPQATPSADHNHHSHYTRSSCPAPDKVKPWTQAHAGVLFTPHQWPPHNPQRPVERSLTPAPLFPPPVSFSSQPCAPSVAYQQSISINADGTLCTQDGLWPLGRPPHTSSSASVAHNRAVFADVQPEPPVNKAERNAVDMFFEEREPTLLDLGEPLVQYRCAPTHNYSSACQNSAQPPAHTKHHPGQPIAVDPTIQSDATHHSTFNALPHSLESQALLSFSDSNVYPGSHDKADMELDADNGAADLDFPAADQNNPQGCSRRCAFIRWRKRWFALGSLLLDELEDPHLEVSPAYDSLCDAIDNLASELGELECTCADMVWDIAGDITILLIVLRSGKSNIAGIARLLGDRVARLDLEIDFVAYAARSPTACSARTSSSTYISSRSGSVDLDI